MKILKSELQQIIKEEVDHYLQNENSFDSEQNRQITIDSQILKTVLMDLEDLLTENLSIKARRTIRLTIKMLTPFLSN